MPSFPLHELNDQEFEDLVSHICRKILGEGTTSFSKGRDGGKDALFEGEANHFPSKSSPLKGKVIIQAKHTSNIIKSCSDNDFIKNKSSIVQEEIPKIKKQVKDEEVTHYLLFTNRKKSGGSETKFNAKIMVTGVQQSWLRGNEDIQNFLKEHPEIIQILGFNKLRSPISFTPEDMCDVIHSFYENKEKINHSLDSQYDFKDYPGIIEKNKINGLSEDYHKYIQSDSLPQFSQIESFLKNPRNRDLAEQYHAVADELKGQLILHKDNFDGFDDALEHVYRLMHERSPALKNAGKRRLVKIFIHYMYWNCDIGEKES